MLIDLIINKQNTLATFKDARVHRVTDYGSDHYLVKAKFEWNRLKSKAKSEQIKVKYCYLAFKVGLLMSDRLIVDFEGMADDLYNHLEKNVSSFAFVYKE